MAYPLAAPRAFVWPIAFVILTVASAFRFSFLLLGPSQI